MSDTPRTDEVWKNMHGSGYQMMLLCQKLERELADAKEIEKMRDEEIASVREVAGNATIRFERELAEVQKECGTAIRKSLNEITYREMAEEEADKWLRLCTEWSEANVKLILRAEQAEAELSAYKLWAEVEIADLREDLSDHIRMAKDAQEDAGRYRWLRDMNNDEAAVKLFSAWCGQNLDEAIDEAIAGSAT